MSEPIIWQHCYNDSWQGVITPEAFAHPAKFARGLIRRIYQHMLERGYIAPGDSIIDPFGGVGLGGLDAMTMGLHWAGCELEPRFVELGNANIDKWRRDLAMLNGKLGTARLVQGDSRRLGEIVGGGVGAAVSSPPFEGVVNHDGGRADYLEAKRLHSNYGASPGQLGSMPSGSYAAAVSSPPYGESLSSPKDGEDIEEKITAAKLAGATAQRATWGSNQGSAGWSADSYGGTPGQLATLRADDAGFAAAVSSPPYADAVNGQGEGPGARHDPIYHNGDNAYKQSSDNGYGETPGNLGSMAGEGFEAAVSSPPYADGTIHGGSGIDETKYADKSKGRPEWSPNNNHKAMQDYGDSLGNIGNDTGETFWSAARVIIEQTYSVLRPGGYAAWVCKDFVRRGQRVPFSDQWESLCAAVGFQRVERIHALLVEEHGEQLDIFGGATLKRKERKSFFRRLAEKNGSPRIDHEDVIIMRKPLFAARGEL